MVEESKSSSNPISAILSAGIIALVLDRLFWYGMIDGGAVSAILFVIIIRPAIILAFLIVSVLSLLGASSKKKDNKASNEGKVPSKNPSSAGRWQLRTIGLVFCAIGIWSFGVSNSTYVNSSEIVAFSGFCIFCGILLFVVTLRTNIQKLESNNINRSDESVEFP